MSVSAELRVVHVASGRVRVHWPREGAGSAPDIRRLLASITGAREVRANALTENVLVQFDERVTTADGVLTDLRQAACEAASDAGRRSSRGGTDDRPMARAEPRSGRARPSAGRPRAEWSSLELVERAAWTTGAFAGLGIVAMRGRRANPLPASRSASALAAAVTLIDGFSRLRDHTDSVLGERGRVMLLRAAGIAAHTVSGSPLGLAVTALVSTHQLRRSLERRRALEAYGRGPSAEPVGELDRGTRFDEGDRLPVEGRVLSGVGFAVGRDALLRAISPGSDLAPGERLYGGPFRVVLRGEGSRAGTRERLRVRDEPVQASRVEAAAFAAAAVTLLATRSLSRAAGVLLLLSRRTEILGREAADAGAAMRALRSGALPLDEGVVIRRPDVVLIESPRVIADGFEVARADVLAPSLAASEAVELALSVAALAGSPWGPIRSTARCHRDGEGSFDGCDARAVIDDRLYALRLGDQPGAPLEGHLSLALSVADQPLAAIRLRPRLAADATELAAACRRLGVELVLAHEGLTTSATCSLARAAGLKLLRGPPAELVRRLTRSGKRVAFVTDSGADVEALTHTDLSMGLATRLAVPFRPIVDVLVPDLATAGAVIEAGARRDVAVRDERLLSLAATGLGAAWTLAGQPNHHTATRLPNLATIVTLLGAWLRLRGGSRPRSSTIRLVDPQPEQWGRRTIDDVLRALGTREGGLSRREAAARLRVRAPERRHHPFVTAVTEQLRSPLTGILVVGAGLSLATGAVADVVLISAVIALNGLLGGLQERHTQAAVEELERIGRVTSRVLRDGRRVRLPASELAPGDILFLAPGERVGADARVLRSRGLEVDEASLTGESFPVAKRAEGGSPEARVVLDGTDATAGSGRAIVFAVGPETRFGATAAALAGAPTEESPLGRRLHRMLLEVLPIVVGGGALVIVAGLLWRRPLAARAGARCRHGDRAPFPRACRCSRASARRRSPGGSYPATCSSAGWRRSNRWGASTSRVSTRRGP